jgi:hypothetical protein
MGAFEVLEWDRGVVVQVDGGATTAGEPSKTPHGGMRARPVPSADRDRAARCRAAGRGTAIRLLALAAALPNDDQRSVLNRLDRLDAVSPWVLEVDDRLSG